SDHLTLMAGDIANQGGSLLSSKGDVSLTAGRFQNEGGLAQAQGNLNATLGSYASDGMARLVAQQVMVLSLSGELSNNGLLGGGTGLTVSAASIQNGKQGHLLSDQGDVNLKTVQGGIENQGIVEKRNASGQLSLSAPFVRNEGTLLSAGIVALDKVQDVVNASTIYGARGLTGQIAGTFENSNGLFVVGGQEAHIEAARVINEAGSIRAVEGGLTLQVGQIDNRGGQIDAVADVQLQSDFLANQNGLIQATGNLALGRHDAQIENSQGTLQAGHDVAITAAHLANDNGKVLALGGDLTVNNAVAASDAKMADGQATALDNEAGILQAARAVALGLSALKDDAHSIITASKYLSLSGIAPLTVNGLMLGGEGVSLQSSGLSVTPSGQIISSNGQLLLGLDGNNLNNQGLIQAQGQDARLVVQATGSVMNSGTLLSTGSMGLESQNQLINGGTLGTLGGDLAIQAQNLNNQGKIVSSGWLDSTITGDVHNVGQMYGQKGQTLSGGNIANQKGEISAQGDLTLQGQSLTNDNGHIISDAGNITAHIADSASSHGGLVQGLGNVTITSGTFDNSQRGIILSKQGAVQLSAAHQFDNRGGTIQAARDVQLTALSLDNSGGGLINAVSGGVDVTASGGDGMDTLHNEGGTIQANGDLHLAAQHLSNADGKILQQSDDYGLSIDDGVGKLTDVAVGSAGTIQTKGSLSLAVNSLHGFGTLIAPKDLNVMTYTPDTDTFFQAGRDATVTILGDYNIATGAGVLAGRNAIVQAASIRNDGALMANGGILTVHSGRDVYNTGLLYGATGLVTTLPGTLTNYKGAVLTGNGGMVLSGPNGGAMSSLLNQSGQITATGSDSDIDIAANRLTNDIVGGVARKDTGEKRVWYYARGEWRSKGNPARIPIPVGFLDAKGEQATGTLIMSLLSTYVGKHRGEAEVTKKEIYSVANNAAPLLSAGRDIHVSATGGLLNDGGHIAAGRDMALSGAALQNVGYTDERIFKIGCLDHRGCGWKTEGGTVPSFKHTDGRLGKTKRAKAFTWGTFYLPGLSGTIAAGGNITGSFTGSITNQTKLAGDLEALQGVQFLGKRPDGLRRQSPGSNFFVAAASSQDKSGGLPQLQPDKAPPVMVTASQAQPLSLPGFSGTTVSVSASSVSVAKWKPADTPVSGSLAAGEVSVPVGRTGAPPSSATVHQVDGSTLPGQSAPSMSAGGRPAGEGVSKNTSGNAVLYVPATSLHAVVASIPASGTLFVPNPSPSVHYLLETNPRYATFAGLYGSDYLLGRLGHSMGDYRFLGDSGFDTQYVQQQMCLQRVRPFLVEATRQPMNRCKPCWTMRPDSLTSWG
ncbi:hypothetical protein J3T99_05225, partial [Acetobacteraceae bacterium B3987]|nr:hypothetical protein [Acetobacteraceae bacterium B3987]